MSQHLFGWSFYTHVKDSAFPLFSIDGHVGLWWCATFGRRVVGVSYMHPVLRRDRAELEDTIDSEVTPTKEGEPQHEEP